MNTQNPTSPKGASSRMYVLKRDGRKEPVFFDKITLRLQHLCELKPELDPIVDPTQVTQRVIQGVFPGVKTVELDNLAAETAAFMITIHPGYGDLAARIAVSNLHKETSTVFSDVMELEYNHVNAKTKEAAPLIGDEYIKIIREHKDVLNAAIVHDRDFSYDYFGFKTLEKSYLVRLNGQIVERPQMMLMRVSIGIHRTDIASVLETYNLLSQKYFTHATPTLFNACSPMPQLSSCFLLTMKEDSIEGIYETLKRCALISKSAGGIGLSISSIRASNSYIKGTNGASNGLVPMIRVFNDTARYVDQGGGKRKGAFALYLEPWHFDVLDFLDLKKNHGKEENRARDLFYALWIPDLFMKRVEQGGSWSLFCPNECPGLADTWGEEFERLYTQYENQPHLVRKTIKAQDLWFTILESQIETGTPYMLYKDSCNRKSNQQNLGTIKSSNLCCEIVEYTAPDEVAVCNLASIALPKFVDVANRSFDHHKLYQVVKALTKNLNRVIDVNYYPIPEARNSNMRHRPVGLGVQGLADTFLKMRLPFDSEGAALLNKDIFETIYFGALSASRDLAKSEGPYESYPGSPISKGIFQFDMWGVTPSDRWDWSALRADVMKHGVRNSLLVAPMPTASTSQILGNTECFEPYTSNMYSRRVLAGEFTIVNRQLVEDLTNLELWSPEMKNEIVLNNGSVQNIDRIPAELKSLYKTCWELSMRTLIDMAADRGAFIDQSQSFNVFVSEPTLPRLTSMHFYAWKKGLKTGMYYLRTRPAADPIKFTVTQQAVQQNVPQATPASPSKAVQIASHTSPKVKKELFPEEQPVQAAPLYCTREMMEAGCEACGA
eukprot:TRINITY_DN9225_c0_g1_i2.p1 TRINITY_DN9225_c0_g1~~TRINITY_DN9225_c0_g1_i2.p1  ORF type:complete len:835 (+),score=270.54 TRINITY_DN9225_c0_g1_i2:34-2538(+)